MTKKTIGLFGGTFDPIHLGHINLAIEMLENAKVDEILFCPVNISPHKIDSPPIASAEHRFKMVQLAIEGVLGFNITDMEIESKGVSYTIETLEKLQKNSKNNNFKLILAKDSASSFTEWKDFAKIMQIAPLLIGVSKEEKKSLSLPFIENRELIEVPMMDISSTRVRKRLQEKEYSAHLLPPKVLDYIYEHHLYLTSK